MSQAANWLINRGVSVALTASDGDGRAVVRKGPLEFLSFLTEAHVVYAAGAPSMVDSVRRIAASVGARFSADPFYPTNQKPTFRNVVMRRLHWAKPALIQEEMPI
jgi:3-phenylpropionate/trans-cinnamate dioxygenase ferredoxin reductase subunit